MDRIPYVILLTSDLTRSTEFYRDVLQLPERAVPPTSEGRVAFALQGTTLVLLPSDGHPGDNQPVPENLPAGSCYPSFTVPDIEEFHRRLKQNGVRCLREPERRDFGMLAIYADPDGLPISIVQKREQRDKHAVVLSGGGAFGAFEIGILRALVNGRSPSTGKEELEPEIFTGTSVGAYNAAALVSQADLGAKASVAHLEELWLQRIAGDVHDNGVLRLRGDMIPMFDPRRVIRRPLRPLLDLVSDTAYLSYDAARRLGNLTVGSGSLVRRLIEMVDFGSLISTEPLQRLVRETISLEKILRSDRILKLAATDWVTGAVHLFVHGQDTDPEKGEEPLSETNGALAVLASAAIPGVFPAITIENTPYVDGGVVMNTPLKPAIKADATVIHLICLNPDASDIPLDGPPNTVDIFERLLTTAVSGHVNNDIEMARFINTVAGVARRNQGGDLYREITIHRYRPDIDLGGLVGMLDFRGETLEKRIEAGWDEAVGHDCEKEGCVVPGARYRGIDLHEKTVAQTA